MFVTKTYYFPVKNFPDVRRRLLVVYKDQSFTQCTMPARRVKRYCSDST